MDTNWNLDNHDKLKLIEVTEDSLLDIVATSKGPFEPLPIIKDENIPLRNRAKVMATLMLLKNKGLVKSDDLGLKYTITMKAKLERLYAYKGWTAIGVFVATIAGIISYFAWVHPITTDGSKSPPRDTIAQKQNSQIKQAPPNPIVLPKSNADSAKRNGHK